MMLNKLLITKSTSAEEIRQAIGKLREQKGKEKETLKLIEEALSFEHGFVVNLLFEQALTYQHLYMNDNSNKKALFDMEKTILKACFYVNKYKLMEWNSRLFRFMGRVADYRGQCKKAISYYKKSIKFVNLDPEPSRILELEAFLSFGLIMSGKCDKGYKQARVTYKKFISSDEGTKLKRESYATWIIWLSGLVIRTVNALFDKKANYDKKETNTWISLIENELKSKPNDFSYRKEELRQLKLKFN